jgi:hypothetical protein
MRCSKPATNRRGDIDYTRFVAVPEGDGPARMACSQRDGLTAGESVVDHRDRPSSYIADARRTKPAIRRVRRRAVLGCWFGVTGT